MPAMDYEVDIDLHNHEIKNVVIDKVSSDPAGTEGQIIYNTTEKVLKYFHDSAWVTLAQGGDLSGYQLRAEKNQNNGYAGLDAGGKVAIAQLPVGNAASNLVQLAAQLTNGQVIQFNGTGFVGRDLSGIYIYKGTKATYAELPTSDQQTGDVYNVEQAYNNYPAGTNWAWNGTAWDALGGSIDLSGYQTVANLADDLTSPSASTYPSTQAVSDALAGKQEEIDLTPNMAVVSDADGGLEASSVTATELGYLSGVTSSIQTQLGGKQATITGAATTITTADLTADRVVVSSSTGKVAASTVTATELGYLAGVTSGIQGQITAVTSALADKVDALDQGPTAGTYAKVTVNEDGLVTAGQAKIAVADISDIATTYIPQTQRGSANGVASLDGSSQVPYAQMPVGNAANKVVGITAAGTAGQAVVVNEGANGFTFATLLERSTGTISGNGTQTSFPIEHGLRGPPVGYVIVNDSTKKAIQAEVTYTNDTTITVAFSTAPATGTDYTVYMVG